MIVLLDTSEALEVCGMELGCEVEQLLTPLTRFLRQQPHHRFAVDNGAFAGFDKDGIERLPIPWKQIEAIFIGGTTAFKLGESAKAVIRAAQAMGKWVHVGRVNAPGRFEYFENLGADSIDGTGLSRYSWMRERIWKSATQPNLLDVGPTVATERRRSTPLNNQVDELVPLISGGEV